MTKIKIDIESDEDIVSAKLLLKHADGSTELDDADIECKPTNKKEKKSIAIEKGIDEAFMETY